MHENEILDLSDGPLRYCGWSSCYRREAGAAGKDTSGIIRVHQFDKVEMFVYTKQEDSYKEHEHLLAMEQEMLGKVEVPYRIIDTAAGDLGSSAARKFDCEAWVPTQGRYRELTSTSNCTEYQARRLNIRERMEDGAPSSFRRPCVPTWVARKSLSRPSGKPDSTTSLRCDILTSCVLAVMSTHKG